MSGSSNLFPPLGSDHDRARSDASCSARNDACGRRDDSALPDAGEARSAARAAGSTPAAAQALRSSGTARRRGIARVVRGARDAALVRRIVGKKTSDGRYVGSLHNEVCQCCGGIVVTDLRADLQEAPRRRRTCESCRGKGLEPTGTRFCELCTRDAGAHGLELIGEICAPCARRVSPSALPAVLARNARRRFVDRFCETRAQLLAVDRVLEEERFHEECCLEDAARVRAAYERYVRRVRSIERELDRPWTPPPAPDADAPAVARRLDVLVARVLRAPNDIFVRNALLATPKREIERVIRAVQDGPEWWPTRVTHHSWTTVRGRKVLRTLKLTDRLGRSVFASLRQQPAHDLVGGAAQGAGARSRELWNLFPTRWAAEFAAAGLAARLAAARKEKRAQRGSESPSAALH